MRKIIVMVLAMFLYAFGTMAFVAPHIVAEVIVPTDSINLTMLSFLGFLLTNVIVSMLSTYTARRTKALELEYKLEKKDDDFNELNKKYVALLEDKSKAN